MVGWPAACVFLATVIYITIDDIGTPLDTQRVGVGTLFAHLRKRGYCDKDTSQPLIAGPTSKVNSHSFRENTSRARG